MSHSLRRRWTTSLAALATLLSTAIGAGVITATPASAVTSMAWDGGSNYTYFSVESPQYCQCNDQLAQRFVASASGPVARIVLSTPYGSSTPTVQIRSAENYPSTGDTLIAEQVSATVTNQGSYSGSTTYRMSGGQLTAGQAYEIVVSSSSYSYVGMSYQGGWNGDFYYHNYYSGWNDYSYYGLAAQVYESDGADPPTISVSVTPSSADGTNGWYKTAPTVHFTCDDDLAVTDCPADYTVSDGQHDAQTGAIHDENGNETPYTVPALNVDTTPPSVSIGVDNTAAAAAGTYNASTNWYLSTPDFTGSCEDGATCTVDFEHNNQNCWYGYDPSYAYWLWWTYGYHCSGSSTSVVAGGYGHWVRTATDEAGNTATASTGDVNLNPDTPTISGSFSGANAAGWANGSTHWDYNYSTNQWAATPNAVVSWTCNSQYAGVSTCGGNGNRTYVTDETSVDGDPVSGTVTDGSGKTATTAVTVKLDKTAPTVTPVITGTLGQNGWYTSPVTVSWTCDDALSGVKDCTAATDSFTNSMGTSTGNATDVADNANSASITVQSDTVAPAITGTVVTDKGYGGVYDDPITVHWTCTDPGTGNGVSGVGSCPADTTVTGIGSDTVASATVLDNAGNATVGTVSHLFRRVDAPAITVTGAENGKTYAFGTTVTPSCTAVSGSGDNVDCAGTVEGGNADGSGLYVYTATASDPITHLSSTKTVQWVVADRPAVSLVISNVRDEGSYAYGVKVSPTCTATDTDGHTVSCTGVVTGGNTDGSGLFTYKARATDAVTGKVSAARVSWTVGSKPAPSVAVAGVVNGQVYAYGTKVTPSCVAADADGTSLTCDGAVTSSKVVGGGFAYLYKATVTDPSTGLMSAASATWTVAAAGKAAISGLPTTTKAGHPVLVAGKAYAITVSFTGSTSSNAESAPYWLKPVTTNAAGTTGTPRTITGTFAPAARGSYVWTFTPTKAMKGTFRKFGVKTSDGKVTYQTVYVK